LCSQANVRSTTQRTRPSPEPCSVRRRATIGDHPVRSLARPTELACDRANPVNEGEAVRDVAARGMWSSRAIERACSGAELAQCAQAGLATVGVIAILTEHTNERQIVLAADA
jgi:hypothetical protein